jgi:hypothetical protein
MALDQTTLADLIRRVEAARASGDPGEKPMFDG